MKGLKAIWLRPDGGAMTVDIMKFLSIGGRYEAMAVVAEGIDGYLHTVPVEELRLRKDTQKKPKQWVYGCCAEQVEPENCLVYMECGTCPRNSGCCPGYHKIKILKDNAGKTVEEAEENGKSE